MMHEMAYLVAAFNAPLNIGTDIKSLLWIFPLLASIAIIYKATKMRVLFLGKFFAEVIILFCTLSAVMILVAAALHIIARLFAT